MRVYLRPFGKDFLLRINNLNDQESGLVLIPNDFKVIEELTLTANQNKAAWEAKKYTWKTESYEGEETKMHAEAHASNFGRNLQGIQMIFYDYL